VLAFHERRGIRNLFQGSQTSKVLVDGSTSVLVVPKPASVQALLGTIRLSR